MRRAAATAVCARSVPSLAPPPSLRDRLGAKRAGSPPTLARSRGNRGKLTCPARCACAHAQGPRRRHVAETMFARDFANLAFPRFFENRGVVMFVYEGNFVCIKCENFSFSDELGCDFNFTTWLLEL